MPSALTSVPSFVSRLMRTSSAVTDSSGSWIVTLPVARQSLVSVSISTLSAKSRRSL